MIAMNINLIPSKLKAKFSRVSTDTLVLVLYLQWAYLVALAVILSLPRDLVGDWGCVSLPLLVGCLPAILLYKRLGKWRKRGATKDVAKQDNKDFDVAIFGSTGGKDNDNAAKEMSTESSAEPAMVVAIRDASDSESSGIKYKLNEAITEPSDKIVTMKEETSDSESESSSNITPNDQKVVENGSESSGSIFKKRKKTTAKEKPKSAINELPEKKKKSPAVLSKKTQKKIKGAPGKLKKPTNAYMLWFNEVGREQILKENPELNFLEASKKGGQVWKSMEEETISAWKTKAVDLKKKYDTEKKKLADKN